MKDNKYYQELEERGYFDTIDKRSKEYREYKAYLKTKVVNVDRKDALKKGINNLKEGAKIKNDVSNIKKNIDELSYGLGDVVDKITKVTGIKKVVEALTDDCGCDERKEKFNKLFTWKRKSVNCISEEDYKWYVSNKVNKKSKWTFEERERLVKIYNSIFSTNVKNSKCSSCIKGYQDRLVEYINIYNS